MYLPADSLGLTAQIATPISLPGGIAGPIVFGQSLRTSGHGRPGQGTDGTIEPF